MTGAPAEGMPMHAGLPPTPTTPFHHKASHPTASHAGTGPPTASSLSAPAAPTGVRVDDEAGVAAPLPCQSQNSADVELHDPRFFQGHLPMLRVQRGVGGAPGQRPVLAPGRPVFPSGRGARRYLNSFQVQPVLGHDLWDPGGQGTVGPGGADQDLELAPCLRVAADALDVTQVRQGAGPSQLLDNLPTKATGNGSGQPWHKLQPRLLPGRHDARWEQLGLGRTRAHRLLPPWHRGHGHYGSGIAWVCWSGVLAGCRAGMTQLVRPPSMAEVAALDMRF